MKDFILDSNIVSFVMKLKLLVMLKMFSQKIMRYKMCNVFLQVQQPNIYITNKQ